MRRLTCAFVALALAASCKRPEPPVKVVVLGFDGAGWDTIEPLIQAGKLPYLERLRSESAWGPLETFKPTKSPVIWTSIATGMTMEKHGILDFVYLKENESVHDIAPSILHLFDLPVGSAMDGKAATELLNLEREVRFQRYSRELMATAPKVKDEELDLEIREKTLRELRSLGYIP